MSMKKLLLALTIAFGLQVAAPVIEQVAPQPIAELAAFVDQVADAATTTHAVATADTGATPNTSGAFTPALNDLLVVMVVASDTQQVTATLTSSVGGFTFSQAGAFCGYNANQNAIYFFVADALVSSATSQTVTFDTASDAATGTNIMVAAISGITRVGLDAIRQVSSCDFGAGGATGDPVFSVAVLTGNPTLGALGNATNPATVTPPTNWTEAADIGYATPTIGGEYVYRDSGFTGTTFSWVSTFGTAGGAFAIEVNTAATGANFTAGPTHVAVTTTSVQVSFTSDTTGTVKGTLCPNGNAGNAAQTLAGNCTGDVAAVATISEAVVLTVADGATFSNLVPGTIYDASFVIDGTSDSALASLADQTTTTLAFTSAPTRSSALTNGHRFSYTINGAATVYFTWCNPGDAVPSHTENAAGQCGGGNAALQVGNEVAVSGAAETFDLTQANLPVRASLYVSAALNGAVTAVTTLADKDRSPDASQEITVMASVSATGVCDLDSYFNPDCAIGDVFESDATTNESVNCLVNFTTGGDFELAPGVAGACDGRQTFEISYQDVSNATTGLFTAPTGGNFTTDDTIYVNNTAPICSPEASDTIVLLVEDAVMSSRDLTQVCVDDVDLDVLTFSITVGTIPIGTTLSGPGVWSGTPNTENEAGVALTVQACDPAGDCDTYALTAYVVNTWAVPNCVASTAAECADLVVAAAPWRVNDVGLTITDLICSAIVTAGDIISQSPAASAQLTAFEPITIILAIACPPATVVGGIGFSSTGALATTVLGDSDPVPAGSVFINGAARSPTGYTYVAAWPVSGIAYYHGGQALRADGAMIVTTGAIQIRLNAFGYTQRGELCVIVGAPVTFVNTYGFIDGKLAVTAAP